MLIEIKIDMKPEANREAEAAEHISGETRIIKEEVKAIMIEINHIMIRNKIKIPTNWNRTHQYDKRNGGEGWDDKPNDKWIKLTQMQKDTSENHCDKDSIWTEDEAPQNQIITPQPKLLVHYTQRIQQVQVQPKQQALAQVPRQRGRKDQPPNQDDIDEQEILQEWIVALQKLKEQYGISD
ncbi:MAG: hypothetical protein EZS28_000798 [Streblomastix strix]|uniref:Uncharacterized protein n=1 Tax=Streblomastix strix TaxID=222440 RepID=A0A5J4XB04_9EUKA|nr:MAG: hypothetical protein EZS28_000798 [Streblomastix strix]